MKVSLIQGLVLLGVVIFVVACTPVAKPVTHKAKTPKLPSPPLPLYVECKTPRPEACTHQYQPVCANKDTGIRCFKAPCPAVKKVAYGNACGACADKKVYGYTAGACKK